MSQYYIIHSDDELCHHGIKGMHWGVRRYQNADGSLTEAGKKRYIVNPGDSARKAQRKLNRYDQVISRAKYDSAENARKTKIYYAKSKNAKNPKKADKYAKKARKYAKKYSENAVTVNEGNKNIFKNMAQAIENDQNVLGKEKLRDARRKERAIAYAIGGIYGGVGYSSMLRNNGLVSGYKYKVRKATDKRKRGLSIERNEKYARYR